MPPELSRRDCLALAAATAAEAAPASELCFLPATELAARIRRKDVSARELLEAHLRQIERVNPKVNAIVTLVPDQARETARLADEAQAQGKPLGVLHGLPIAHKDLAETKGIRTTFGSPLLKDNVPDKDALIVERIRNAGAVTLGKTNTPEFGAGSQTFNPVFGPTLNPYDLTRTCGGSSGGAAVALACGMLPIADGSDMGGSLRNPASYCNVTGFRPSPGRVPNGAGALSWFTLSVAGPMARTVADVALFLSAIAGPDSRSPISIAEPGSLFARPLARNFKGVRVAWFKDLNGQPFDPRVTAVIHDQRKVFESLGCAVEQAEPDFSGADEVFKTLRAWNFELTQGARVAQHRSMVKDTIQWEVDRGAKLTGPQISRAEFKRGEIYERVRLFFEKYEYFILPVTQVPPFDVTQPYVTEINGVKMESYIDWMRSCYFISTVGNPAISVPAGFTAEGLPTGLQIVGRHQADLSVLQLAAAFEQATGFHRRRPPAV